MLYTKPINEIRYEDVVDFCNQKIKENINLDYKEKIESSIAKTVSSMANTWGGLIIVGVEDDDSAPKLPAIGMEFKEHVEEQINNIILGNINPPVFPEIKICKSTDGKYMFAIIRVCQSNITPHAIQGSTKVYLRTNTSNEPEELATIDRVLWLTNRRQKSIDLKNSFSDTTSKRFLSISARESAPVGLCLTTFSMCPSYPFEMLINHEELEETRLGDIRVQSYPEFHFPMNLHSVEYIPTQFGVYSFKNTCGRIRYEEINRYGFFSFITNLSVMKELNDKSTVPYTNINSIFRVADSMFECMEKFYSKIGYWGILEFKIKLENIQKVTFRHLRDIDYELKPLSNVLEFEREFSFTELKNNRVNIMTSLFTEVSRALGFSITENSIKEYMKINNRI